MAVDKIWVFAESAEGKPTTATLEMLTKARELASTVEALYAGADIFVLASHFEGYGMAYAEAIAHGLPVVGTTGGAIPQTVPPSAGILVPPGDIEALAQVLRELIGNDVRRRALAMGARAEAGALRGNL